MPKEAHSKDRISYLSDSEIEKHIIQDQKMRLRNRAPGKYDTLLFTLDLLSNTIPVTPALEVSYHFGRAVDDITDDDAEIPNGFASGLEWLRSLHSHIDNHGMFITSEQRVEFLLKRAMTRIQTLNAPNFNLEDEFHGFISAMEFEYLRRVGRFILTKQEIALMNNNSFGSPHTITLVTIGSAARNKSIPEMAQLQGRLFGITDLVDDLSKGICNVPLDVVSAAYSHHEDIFLNPQDVRRRPDIQAWIRAEIYSCVVLIRALQQRKLDWKAKLYVKYLLKGLEKHFVHLNSK